MPGSTTPITNREKCAIIAYYLGFLPDWKTAYICAEDKAVKDCNPKGLDTLTSKWKNSEKVQRFGEYIQRYLADRDADARQRGREEARGQGVGESEHPQTKPKTAIDYSNPKERQKQLNTIIASSQDDPKTQLDAIKVFETIQREDKQAAKDNKIQRFYTPITCKECAIYQKTLKAKIKHE